MDLQSEKIGRYIPQGFLLYISVGIDVASSHQHQLNRLIGKIVNHAVHRVDGLETRMP
jgi:hypothetical protein